MTCDEVEILLLQSDDSEALEADGVSERVEAHAAGCAACANLVRKLRRLNEAVRSLPEPSGMHEARLRFERQRAARRWRPMRWLSAAAVLCLVLGGATTAYLHQRSEARAIASSEAIDKAIGLNISLAENDSDEERVKLFTQGSTDLARQSDDHLAGDDREFADHLVHDAKFLTDHHDPLAQADHFTHVADLLITRMDSAGNNPKAMKRLGQAYLDVMNQGVHKNLDLAAASPKASAENQRRLEKIIQRNLQLKAKLEALMRNSPDAAATQKQLDQIEHRLKRLQRAASTQPGTHLPKNNPIR